ncbi:hypothetical protein RFI_20722 [Reticulomyxa filosa]|uniref:Uncharacterized protein n=1 Tax=Reticulomyxa filosa TaxID=46433 RepID=X6MSE9_RETFI|nr:hypothetical protein RFI_20722 [Reticulomyxa filosa]|eukprot:ETO16616.1 hypothetical protein RFI_20722 [Reticulomyxa filosa]
MHTFFCMFDSKRKLTIWKSRTCYEIGMLLNEKKQFLESEIVSRQAMTLSKQIVTEVDNGEHGDERDSLLEHWVASQMLVAVVIASPSIQKYEEALGLLKHVRDWVVLRDATDEIRKKYQQPITTLTEKIIRAFIRHQKDKNTQTTQKNTHNNTTSNSDKNSSNDNSFLTPD